VYNFSFIRYIPVLYSGGLLNFNTRRF
jgi:hypothetical protein